MNVTLHWCMEPMCRSLTWLAAYPVNANENIELILLQLERRNQLL